MSSDTQAFFLPASSGDTSQRFCVFHPAQHELRGRVVYVHPFAEEMNKSRRMAAMQARALAAAGFSVLQIDLHGCGDSSGDFGDASWQGWIDDVLRAIEWLRQRDAAHAQAPLWLWGLRAGCLLTAEAATHLDEPSNLLFWQPAVAGKLLLQQFLRLKLAGDMLGGNNKGLMEATRQQLAQGHAIEVAGYTLSPLLANGLEQSQLKPPQLSRSCRLEWFELTTRDDAALSPVATQTLAKWTAASYQSRNHLVQGPAFWQTSEIEDAPNLIAATTAALLVNESKALVQGTPV